MLNKELMTKISIDMYTAYEPLFENKVYLIWPLADFWRENNRGGVKDVLQELPGFYDELMSRRLMLYRRFGCTDREFFEIVDGFLALLHKSLVDEPWTGQEENATEELIKILIQRAKYRLRPLFIGRTKELKDVYKQMRLGKKGLYKLETKYGWICDKIRDEAFETWRILENFPEMEEYANIIVNCAIDKLYAERVANKTVGHATELEDRGHYECCAPEILPVIAEIMVHMHPVFENRYEDLELLVKALLADDTVQVNKVMSRDGIGLSVGAEIKRVMKDHKCPPDDAVVYVTNALRLLKDKMSEERC